MEIDQHLEFIGGPDRSSDRVQQKRLANRRAPLSLLRPRNLRYPVTFDISVSAEYSGTMKPTAASQRILKGISLMLNDSTFSDFTYIVQGREFKVHKCILANASPVMAKMLTTDMEEAKSNKCLIEHIKSDTFSHLLEFVYSGNFGENFSGTDAIALYDAAYYYEIGDLIEICSQSIRCMLTVENAVELYKWAQPYDLEELKADAWLIIKR